ncbi:MAG: ABC transporter ATP-binding protein [Actinomycetota bacterium]
MARNVIEVRQVVKDYGDVRAVDHVDLAVSAGELFGLIGHNGAGKSTLFKMMLGLVPATAGEIRINGEAVQGPAFRRVRRSIGYLPENVVFYDNLTGVETLHFFADLKDVDKGTCRGLLDKVGLAHAADRRVKGYSKGMRQRLGLAQALLGSPSLLFLDEPTTGLDPEAIREFYRILQALKGEGVTMILTSHILAEIQERVDRLAILKTGQVQAVGTVQALREQVDLPLRMKVRPADAEAARHLGGALAGLLTDEPRMEGEHLALSCHRQAKMPILNILAAQGGGVADILIQEPSLEDVFLGYAG